MATCKYCGLRMDWGQDDAGNWVKLVPIAQHDDLERTHQDENGVLRARHTCEGWTPAVRVVKLAKPVQATDVLPKTMVVDGSAFFDDDRVNIDKPEPERFTLFKPRKRRKTGGA